MKTVFNYIMFGIILLLQVSKAECADVRYASDNWDNYCSVLKFVTYENGKINSKKIEQIADKLISDVISDSNIRDQFDANELKSKRTILIPYLTKCATDAKTVSNVVEYTTTINEAPRGVKYDFDTHEIIIQHLNYYSKYKWFPWLYKGVQSKWYEDIVSQMSFLKSKNSWEFCGYTDLEAKDRPADLCRSRGRYGFLFEWPYIVGSFRVLEPDLAKAKNIVKKLQNDKLKLNVTIKYKPREVWEEKEYMVNRKISFKPFYIKLVEPNGEVLIDTDKVKEE